MNAYSATRDRAYADSEPTHKPQAIQILDLLQASGFVGMTRHEIRNATGFDINIVSARVNALLKRDWAAKRGERMGPHGTNVEVIVAKEFDRGMADDITSGQDARGVVSDIEADRRGRTSNSRQQGTQDQTRNSDRTQGVTSDGARHMATQNVEASNAERVDAAIRFVTDERKGIELWRVGVEIMNLRRAGVLAWPEGNSEQWIAAVDEAVKQGRLVAKDGKVRVAAVVVQKEAKQLDLFS